MVLSCQLCKEAIVGEQPTSKLLPCSHWLIAHRDCVRKCSCPLCLKDQLEKEDEEGLCFQVVTAEPCEMATPISVSVCDKEEQLLERTGVVTVPGITALEKLTMGSEVSCVPRSQDYEAREKMEPREAGEVVKMRETCEQLKNEVQELKSMLKSVLESQATLQGGNSHESNQLEPCSKLFVGPDDIRRHVKASAQLHVDFVPGSELKLPRFMEVVPLDPEEAVAHACPNGEPRLNLATVFRRFEEQPGTVLRQWTPLKELVSWSTLQGRFEYILEYFVRHLPCGADKTISQILTAIFECGGNRAEQRSFSLTEMTYLVGVCRHSATTPFMPFGLWTHAAVFDFAHSVENNASKWLQSLLCNNKLVLHQGSFSNSQQTQSPISPNLQEPGENEIEIAISAGGGSDVVTATAWLAHTGAPEGSLVFHPGRGKPAQYGGELLASVPDFAEPLSKGSQFYSGTDLLARTQHLAKSLGLDYKYFFLLQDKELLGSGSAQQVLEHMNALSSSIAEAVKRFGRCRRIHIVDSGGDVLMTVLHSCGVMGENQVEPRKERDVWNLLLALALQERFDCQVQLVVVAPGIDGQSVWLGPQPASHSSPVRGA